MILGGRIIRHKRAMDACFRVSKSYTFAHKTKLRGYWVNMGFKESYIGHTIKPLKQRWHEHCSKKNCRKLYRAIKKYGKDAFEIKVLVRCNTMTEMNHRETYYIKLFSTLAPRGYNLKLGGIQNGKHSEETKKRMSEAHKGEKSHLYGKRGEKCHGFGKPSGMKGKHHSEETKKKISLSLKKTKLLISSSA